MAKKAAFGKLEKNRGQGGMKMRKSKKVLFVVAILAGVLMVGNPSLLQAADVKAVKIGGLLTLSGSMAVSGKNFKDAIEFAVEEINAQGGIKSLGGAKIEMVYGDSQAKPAVAVSETERLIDQENVLAVVDQYPSSCSVAATSVAERKKTPFIVAISYADAITGRGYKYTFQLEPPAAYGGVQKCLFVEWLGKQLGRKLTNIAQIYENTDWGQSIALAQRQWFKANGYNLVVDESFAAPLSDASSILAKVKAAKPDIVMFNAFITDDLLLVKTGDRLELLNVPWLASGTAYQPAFVDGLKELAEGIFEFNIWTWDISKEATAFNEKYRAKYNKDLDGTSACLYQSMWILKLALEKTGKVDREALAQALREIRIDPGPHLLLPYDYISFDEKGVNKGGKFLFVQVQNGRWVTVYPEKHAGSKLKVMPGWK
jgi:branched-chain amino acid transport system substrate-binding protein